MEWVNEKLKLLRKKVIINAENIFLFNTLLKISLIINRVYTIDFIIHYARLLFYMLEKLTFIKSKKQSLKKQ